MMWKCPRCKYKTSSYQAVQKHYYRAHYKPSAKNIKSKGKEKKVYTFKPKVGKR